MSDHYRKFIEYRENVLAIEVQKKSGDYSIGSAFHVGDGYLLTARHVVEGHSSFRVLPEHGFSTVEVEEVIFPSEENVDIALIKTDFKVVQSNIHYGDEKLTEALNFQLWPTYDDWADGLMLMDIILLGYPPIPRTKAPYLVAAKGHINAVVDRYDGKYVHFIVSCTARGGFSGGPCVSSTDWGVIGICTQAFIRDEQALETGFAAVVGNEAVLNLFLEAGVAPGGQDPDRNFMTEQEQKKLEKKFSKRKR